MINNDVKVQWGFHPYFESYFLQALEEDPNLFPGRVVFASHDHFRVLALGEKQDCLAKLKGSAFYEGLLPSVGDWVLVRPSGGDDQFVPITDVLPARTYLRRSGGRDDEVLVANVDYVALVTSFNRDLNLRRLERGCTMVRQGGATPLIVLNKRDLVDSGEAESILAEVCRRLPGVEVVACAALATEGLASLRARFSLGEVVALLGMSGVGKSTLINALLGQTLQQTAEIREDDARGRHATTHREMFLSPDGFWIVDTPGIRQFSILDDFDGLDEAYAYLEGLFSECCFTDCTHNEEPGCRVQEALARGDLDADRWWNYQKIQKEAQFQAMRKDKAYHSSKKKQWAKRSKELRARLKAKGRKG